ncbi:MAG: hypothetical protein ACK40M_11805 [Flavobacteriales bacterium]
MIGHLQRKIYFGIVFLIFLSIFSSCKKEKIEKVCPDFLGEWHSDTLTETATGRRIETYLKINGDFGEYGFACSVNCTSCECTKLFSGLIRINVDRKLLYFGKAFGGGITRLKIGALPQQDQNEKWLCKINDIVLYKR